MVKSIAERESELELLVESGQRLPPPGIKGLSNDSMDGYNDDGLRLCQQWLKNVSQIVRYDVDDVHCHQFWPAFLHILYL